MSEDILKTLAKKAQQFEDNKERSLNETRNFVQKLFAKLKIIENAMLSNIENIFDENIFSLAIANLNENMTFNTIKEAEATSKKPIPEPIVPKEGDVERLFDEMVKVVGSDRPAPINVIGKTELPGSIELTWDLTPKATGYIVGMKPASQSTFREAYFGANNRAVINGLTTEEKHTLRACACYGAEKSRWSDAVEVKPWCLYVPQSVVGTSDAGDSINVTWEERHPIVRQAISYNVELQDEEGNPAAMTHNSATTSLTMSSLMPGKTYFIRVRSFCQGVTSEWSQRTPVTTKTIKCPRGHNLTLTTTNLLYNNFGTDSICCDCCRNPIGGGQPATAYCCRLCDYDLCLECIKKSSMLHRKQCTRGHTLVLTGIRQRLNGRPFSGITCDICRSSFSIRNIRGNLPIYYCSTCDYDACPECAQKYM